MVALTTPQSSLFRKQMIGHRMTRCHFLVGDVGRQGVLGGRTGGWKMGSDLTADGRAQVNLHSWWITSSQGLVFQEMRKQRWVQKGGKTVMNKSKTCFLATKGLDVELNISKVILYGHLDEWLLFNLNSFEKLLLKWSDAQCTYCWARLKKYKICFHPLGDLSRLTAHFIDISFFLSFFKTWRIFIFNCNVQVFLSSALWTTAGKLCKNEKHWRSAQAYMSLRLHRYIYFFFFS